MTLPRNDQGHEDRSASQQNRDRMNIDMRSVETILNGTADYWAAGRVTHASNWGNLNVEVCCPPNGHPTEAEARSRDRGGAMPTIYRFERERQTTDDQVLETK